MIAQDKEDQLIVNGAITVAEIAILKARRLAKRLSKPRKLKIPMTTIEYNIIMSKVIELHQKEETLLQASRKPDDPLPVIVNGGCAYDNEACLHCRPSNCTDNCEYYPVEGVNRGVIETLEKKRIWKGIRIPEDKQPVPKRDYWWLWSSRC